MILKNACLFPDGLLGMPPLRVQPPAPMDLSPEQEEVWLQAEKRAQEILRDSFPLAARKAS